MRPIAISSLPHSAADARRLRFLRPRHVMNARVAKSRQVVDGRAHPLGLVAHHARVAAAYA